MRLFREVLLDFLGLERSTEGNFSLNVVISDSGPNLARCFFCLQPVTNFKNFSFSRTALHWASAAGQPGAVSTLLELNANPAPVDVDDATPIDYALQSGHQGTVRRDCFETCSFCNENQGLARLVLANFGGCMLLTLPPIYPDGRNSSS